MRVTFDSIFAHIEGRIVPQVHIAIGTIAMAAGTRLLPGLIISGIQIESLVDCDLAVEQADGVMEISGFYKPGEPTVPIQ